MKKLMIVAAAALLAGMSQAAQVAWGNGATSRITGIDGANITAANATAWSLTVTLMNSDGTSTGQSATAINSMNAGVLSGTGLTWTYTYGEDASSGSEFYIHAIMTVDKKDYKMDIYANNSTKAMFAVTATNNTGTDTFSWASGTYGGLADTKTAGKWSAVPEPTSGLLLLLGVAGLALKRKRA